MDRDIRAAVHEELVADPLVDADDIVVEVFNGEVSLNGTVPTQDQDAKAVAAAGRVAGVTVVHNLLAIALPSRDYGDDAALAQLVNAALAANRAVPDGVRATARHGDIFLTGTVSYGAQRAAPKTPWPAWPGCSASPIRSRSRRRTTPGGLIAQAESVPWAGELGLLEG
jgi:osmotically-inducible protein OsmY